MVQDRPTHLPSRWERQDEPRQQHRSVVLKAVVKLRKDGLLLFDDLPCEYRPGGEISGRPEYSCTSFVVGVFSGEGHVNHSIFRIYGGLPCRRDQPALE